MSSLLELSKGFANYHAIIKDANSPVASQPDEIY